uniref:Uncharacterized protein n=1 Tax=viral metagenome TaxID=1070528 RepID=A0A6H1ZKD6_9ZZZZ
MATVQSVIDELRFDMVDESDTDITDDNDIVPYLQRGVDLIYDIVTSMRASIGVTRDSTTYAVSGATTLDAPLALASVKSVARVYRNDVRKPLSEANWDVMEYLCQTTGPPTRWLFMDEALYIAPTPDLTYNITLHYYGDVTLSRTGNMPFSSRMDHYIREAARSFFMARNEHDLKAYMAIRDHFKREAMTYLERLSGQQYRTIDLAWGYEGKL